MSEQQNEVQETAERKKISLADAMKQKLAEKKQAQANNHEVGKHQENGVKMKSQQTKKQTNHRRKMGG